MSPQTAINTAADWSRTFFASTDARPSGWLLKNTKHAFGSDSNRCTALIPFQIPNGSNVSQAALSHRQSHQPRAAITTTRTPHHAFSDCPDFKKTVAKKESCLRFFYLNKCHFSISETGEKTKKHPARASSNRLKRAFQAPSSQISSFQSHFQQSKMPNPLI